MFRTLNVFRCAPIDEFSVPQTIAEDEELRPGVFIQMPVIIEEALRLCWDTLGEQITMAGDIVIRNQDDALSPGDGVYPFVLETNPPLSPIDADISLEVGSELPSFFTIGQTSVHVGNAMDVVGQAPGTIPVYADITASIRLSPAAKTDGSRYYCSVDFVCSFEYRLESGYIYGDVQPGGASSFTSIFLPEEVAYDEAIITFHLPPTAGNSSQTPGEQFGSILAINSSVDPSDPLGSSYMTLSDAQWWSRSSYNPRTT